MSWYWIAALCAGFLVLGVSLTFNLFVLHTHRRMQERKNEQEKGRRIVPGHVKVRR